MNENHDDKGRFSSGGGGGDSGPTYGAPGRPHSWDPSKSNAEYEKAYHAAGGDMFKGGPAQQATNREFMSARVNKAVVARREAALQPKLAAARASTQTAIKVAIQKVVAARGASALRQNAISAQIKALNKRK